MNLIIGHLYGDLMNTYGDDGNIIVLKKRAEWRGIDVKLKVKSLKSRIREGECDVFFFGGGQDQAQGLVASNLIANDKGDVIKKEIERGVPLLSICGGYQLLGEYYKPHKGPKLPGLGIFPAFTTASDTRMIGNIIIESQFGKLIGFENHSGKTFLKRGALPLGTVTEGFGNNGEDQTEGCVYKNAIGCYMHGSLLPKNPHLADWLIRKALEAKYKKDIVLKPLEDSLEATAHDKTIQMFS
ncbi:MAG: CobB/CobQ domain protein glutamine amidotransferase [Candidatus Daviesbacteria bacterium GW2011_GWA1_38_7]|nr:MAG: CobB/CobQ domain protein glutamine amidotransferase [Candidatus Daviesbacteria bacterium GW2011_GWA1_38_7]